MSDFESEPFDPSGTGYAQGRLSDRTYFSKSFPLSRSNSEDAGKPARYIYKVFDPLTSSDLDRAVDGEDWLVGETPGGRMQLRILIAREAGNVKDLWIQRVPAPGEVGMLKTVINLKEPELGRFLEVLRALDSIDPVGELPSRIDSDVLTALLADSSALHRLYAQDRAGLRSLIESDDTAADVVAVAHRRRQLEEFKERLADDSLKEADWQAFFQGAQWIFGLALGAQLLTSWDTDRLEQTVVGHSVGGPGKRADALLRTAGVVRSMVFVEIKTPKAALLGKEYRPGCWSASEELSGALAQVQGTVQLAIERLGNRLQATDADGAEVPLDVTYLLRPRSILVMGSLTELTGEAGGHNPAKVRSFELLRRNLAEPEIITFDELLARAEWTLAGDSSG